MLHKERYNRQETFSNLQWKEKTHPGNSVGQEESEGSRTRRPPLERTLDLDSVPSHRGGHTTESFTGANPPGHGVIIPSTEEVMGELREITVQYTSCADPTESAARKHRVVQGETRGMMAETAAIIIAAAKRSVDQANSGNIEIPQERGAITLPEPPSRVSALDRIIEPIAPKKKRGRPPCSKPGSKSPMRLSGAKSQKRNLFTIQQSPKRRGAYERDNPLGEENNTEQRKMANNQSSPQVTEGNGASCSTVVPRMNLIPASIRDKVDFPNPLDPLP
ncbi:hypothetical protein V5N11_029477 [Cardamine amara subsp. amara]|uniref:Uncharacterized protein n=1 Tax=Cardamine amara subsp. amara TaxID=228776 RepID=A0ABD1C190_CARAN